MRHNDDTSAVFARLKLDKCANECITYHPIQHCFALCLQDDQEIVSFECNVAIPDFEDGQYTSDFVCRTADGGVKVYECAEKYPAPDDQMRLLLRCDEYWKTRAAAEWSLVVPEKFSTADGEQYGLMSFAFADTKEELDHLLKRYPLFPKYAPDEPRTAGLWLFLSKPVERLCLQTLSGNGNMNMPSKFILFKHVRCAFMPIIMWQKRMLSFITPCVRLNLLGGREPLRFSCAALCRAFFILEECIMPNYEYLYHLMVNASEDAITALEGGNVWDAKRILIEAEQRAEELYIQGAEETVTC